ncbi:hypothetical protein, partial [Burkholderia pseudomallei]|uniref:hypothetical protein n=1 Tax=Burkholderia pseudomallei TaxID=28450 RepID=UPI00387DD0F4
MVVRSAVSGAQPSVDSSIWHDGSRRVRAPTPRRPRYRNEQIRTRGNRTTRGWSSSPNDRAQRRRDARRVVRPSAGARCGWIATITHPLDDASQRGFEQMDTGVGLARRLPLLARAERRPPLSSLPPSAGRARSRLRARSGRDVALDTSRGRLQRAPW